jgi:hypothetical protein
MNSDHESPRLSDWITNLLTNHGIPGIVEVHETPMIPGKTPMTVMQKLNMQRRTSNSGSHREALWILASQIRRMELVTVGICNANAIGREISILRKHF